MREKAKGAWRGEWEGNAELWPVTDLYGSWGKATDRAEPWIIRSCVTLTAEPSMNKTSLCDPWPRRDEFCYCLNLFSTIIKVPHYFPALGRKSQHWGPVKPNLQYNFLDAFSFHLRTPKFYWNSLKISPDSGSAYMAETWQSSQRAMGTRTRVSSQPTLYAFPLNLGRLPGWPKLFLLCSNHVLNK